VKIADVTVGMVVQVRPGFAATDNDPGFGALYVGRVLAAGYVRTIQLERATTVTRADGTAVDVDARPKRDKERATVAVVELTAVLQAATLDNGDSYERGEWKFASQVDLIIYNDIVREWTPDVERSVLAARAQRRRDLVGAAFDEAAAEERRRVLVARLGEMVPADLVPRWAIGAGPGGPHEDGRVSLEELVAIVEAAASAARSSK
jgi:hypothetical protein